MLRNKLKKILGLWEKCHEKYLDFRVYKKSYKNIMLFPFLKKEVQEAYLNKRLYDLVWMAVHHVPFYKKFKNEIDFENFSTSELRKLPIVNKKIISQNLNSFLHENISNLRCRSSKTSGSTGVPFSFYVPYESDFIDNLFLFRAWSMGSDYVYTPGDWVVNIRSYIPELGQPLYRFEKRWPQKNVYLSPFHINGSSVLQYCELINSIGTKIIRAYPSSLYIFTLALKERGLFLKNIRTLITASETLLPKYREVIESYWGVPVLDWYGLNERVSTVQQCYKGTYHNNDDYGMIHLGEEGEIISTSLLNNVMPFINYDTGDMAEANDQEECECGMSLSAPILKVYGRQDDILFKLDETRVPPVNIYTLMHSFPSLIQFQMIQEKDFSLDLYLRLRSSTEESLLECIKSEIQKRFGMVDVRMHVVAEIPRNQLTGKIRAIICKVE